MTQCRETVASSGQSSRYPHSPESHQLSCHTMKSLRWLMHYLLSWSGACGQEKREAERQVLSFNCSKSCKKHRIWILTHTEFAFLSKRVINMNRAKHIVWLSSLTFEHHQLASALLALTLTGCSSFLLISFPTNRGNCKLSEQAI